MALSIKWTPFACPYTNGFSPNGCVRGPEQVAASWVSFNPRMLHNLMKWKSNHCDDTFILTLSPFRDSSGSCTYNGKSEATLTNERLDNENITFAPTPQELCVGYKL